eukprot:4430870-Pleurochrysis_carterae.AAC.2
MRCRTRARASLGPRLPPHPVHAPAASAAAPAAGTPSRARDARVLGRRVAQPPVAQSPVRHDDSIARHPQQRARLQSREAACAEIRICVGVWLIVQTWHA